jgi:PAS domain S-box-containing protein
LSALQILIADDHDLFRRTVRSFIESKTDWRICDEAADGMEALQKARAQRPDIVLMDINMPRMDGLEAARVLHRELPECNVIIVTQNHASIARQQAASVNAKAYITKPDLTQQLLPKIEAVMRGAKPDIDRILEEGQMTGWLAGGGALGQLVRTFDWSQTPLGPIERWPQSLQAVAHMLLTSRFAMWMSWGPDLTFLYNDAYAKMTLGKKHPWALGKPSQKVWEEIWNDIGPRIRKVLETGAATWDEALLLFLERSGYREETYHTFSYSPLLEEQGKVAGHLCVVTEETDRVIGERRLETLRSLAAELSQTITEEEVIDSVSDSLAANQRDLPFSLIYLFSPNADQARLACTTGIPAGHAAAPSQIKLGEAQQEVWPLGELIHEERSMLVENLDQRFESLPAGFWDRSPSRALIVPITSQGQNVPAGAIIAGLNPYRPLDVSYSGFIDLVAGQIAASIANARAYEEEKKRAQALAEIDQAKTRFFNNVSHEFRTPLTLMLGPLQDLLSRSMTHLSPTAKEQVELATRNGARLLRLVNTLLDFSRIEAGRVQAVYQATDLARFTAELASVFRSATDRAGLQLNVNCHSLSEPAYVDRDMWEKIVLNLISNAFKFTFEGEIAVTLEQVDRTAELRIRDTGVGIPEQEIPRLFERFHRIPESRSRTHEGSGIGLALVHELVKLHGGSIRVESTVGAGSTFIVSIPLGQDHLASAQVGGDRALSSTATGAAPFVEEALRWLPEQDNSSMSAAIIVPDDDLLAVPCPPVAEDGSPRSSVVVADDNADMRLYLARLLSERYQVRVVPNGKAALEAIREQMPSLLLCDVMMPELDGFALLRKLREDARTKKLPVILLSARAGEESRLEGLKAGADDYMVKPFSARELIARIQARIELAKVREEADQLIRAREQRLRFVAERARVGYWDWNLATGALEWDPVSKELFGIPQGEEMSYERFLACLHPEDRERTDGAVRACLDNHGRTEYDTEYRAVLPDGAQRWIHAKGSAIFQDGKPLRMAGIAVDISDRRQAHDLLATTQELRDLSGRILQAQDDERRRIARELHDGAGQLIAALGMEAANVARESDKLSPRAADSLRNTATLISQMSRDIRTMSYLLHPPLLDEVGLQSALADYVSGFGERSGIRVNLDIRQPLPRLDRESELCLFRIVQESLTNVHRHSSSQVATVHVDCDDDQLTLEIRDQGKGIPAHKLSEVQSRGGGVGIRGMQERVRQFSGNLQISSDSSGTVVRVTMPTGKTIGKTAVTGVSNSVDKPLQTAV